MSITNYFNCKHKVMLINRHFGYSLTRSVHDTPCKETKGWCLSHSLHITPQIRICLWNFIQIRIYRVDVMVKIGTCATDKPVDQSQLPIGTTWSVKSQTDPPSSFASLKRNPKKSRVHKRRGALICNTFNNVSADECQLYRIVTRNEMKTNLDTLTEIVLIYLASFNTVYNCPRGRRL